MANTLKNFTITKNTVIIDDKPSGKFMLVSNTLMASFLVIMGVQYYSKQGFNLMSGLLLVIGSLLLGFSMYMSFKVSFKTNILSSEIDGLKAKTAITGHNSLRLMLKNGRYRNLYLDPSEIPAVIKALDRYGIKLQA